MASSQKSNSEKKKKTIKKANKSIKAKRVVATKKTGRFRSLRHDAISTTQFARNVSKVIDNVRISGKSIYIKKGTQTVAELSPPPKSGIPITSLGDFFESLPKLGEDSATMANDLRKIREESGGLSNPWD